MRHFIHSSMLLGLAWLALASEAGAGSYKRVNLVSNLPGLATLTDPNLVNPWGISRGPVGGNLWVSDNHTGVTTLYNGDGLGKPIAINPLVVTIPPGTPGGRGTPTGQVFNNAANGDFKVTGAGGTRASIFLFATEDGTISGWNPQADLTHAIIGVNNPSASYKGLAVTQNSAGGNMLYAADFLNGKIDVFDNAFASVVLGPGAFTDPNIPTGFSPFNIQLLGGQLFVAYAMVDPASGDEIAGPGLGFVDVFNPDGSLVHSLFIGDPVGFNSPLDAPWGFALAPADFSQFGNALLVGNFGNSHVNAFDPTTGAFLGALNDDQGNPLALTADGQDGVGLWGLVFGNGKAGGNGIPAGSNHRLYFAAGIHDEVDGLFGSIQAVPEPSTLALLLTGGFGLGALRYCRRRKAVA